MSNNNGQWAKNAFSLLSGEEGGASKREEKGYLSKKNVYLAQ
jgi:hypothetical protein